MRRAQILALVTLAVLVSSACGHGPGGAEVLAFPPRAHLGETVAFAISGTSTVILGPWKKFDVDASDLEVDLMEAGTGTYLTTVPARIVVDSELAKTAAVSQAQPGLAVTVVVFDLPQSIPGGFPQTVELVPVRISTQAALYSGPLARYAKLEIIGDAATGMPPTSYWPFASDADLNALPMLRLQFAEATVDPAEAVGSLEFEVSYPTAALSNPRAFTASDATNAAVAVREIAPGVARVVVVHPSSAGMTFPQYPGTGAGGGPFVDVVFDKAAPFAVGDFTIRDLYVTRPDGNTLIDDRGSDSTALFDRFARANQ